MRTFSHALSCIAALWSAFCAADSNISEPLTSKQILPSQFKPPQVFKNAHLVRTVDLTKHYARETINIAVENIDKKPQDEYYLPFESDIMSRIGGLEVRYKSKSDTGTFQVEAAEYDTRSPTEFYLIRFPEPLAPSARKTISISYNVLAQLQPLPAQVEQMDPQFVKYTTSAYAASAYLTENQKTTLKLPATNIPEYTKLPGKNAETGAADPEQAGGRLTYGPYNNIPAGAAEPISARYEFTKPLIHASLLERDIEVSHWGGNLATEERYWLTNRAAQLKNHFSRVKWQMTQYSNPPTHALKELRMPLKLGSMNAYFTDDIGNVSTSRFRPGKKEIMLDLKPRYPLFGGWKYSFRVGWDGDLSEFLRKLNKGDGYALKVPFLEGPKMGEGIEYERVDVRVILPEGAKNVQFSTTVPLALNSTTTHRTFMDTLGRPSLKLTALNVVDDLRDRELVVTYDYPWTAGYRKPLVIASAIMSVFVAAWLLGNLDVSISGKAKRA